MPGPRSSVVVGVRATTAGRSPCWETMEAKCSGTVCGRRGGWVALGGG